MSSTSILLYSLAILGSECASELVKNVLFSSSDIWSARFVSELKPSSMKDMGNLMKVISSKITNADMSLVSKIVKDKLLG